MDSQMKSLQVVHIRVLRQGLGSANVLRQGTLSPGVMSLDCRAVRSQYIRRARIHPVISFCRPRGLQKDLTMGKNICACMLRVTGGP